MRWKKRNTGSDGDGRQHAVEHAVVRGGARAAVLSEPLSPCDSPLLRAPVRHVGIHRVSEVSQRLWTRPATAIVGAAVVTLLFQVACTDLSRAALEQDELANGDSYTWLALVKAWDETGQWTPVVATHNAPNGLETHLTRPFAAVVLGLAALLDPWYADGEAVQAAGKLSGPLLYVATSAVLAWGVWRLIGTAGALLAAIAYLAMPVSPLRFGLQEFDHHALHCLLTALTVSLLLHAVPQDAPKGGRLAGLAGAAAGLGIWSGVELLIPGAIGGAALGLAWILWGERRRARVLGLYALGMALMLAAALVIERPSVRWTSLHLDSISAAHVLMAGILAVGAVVPIWWEARGTSVGGAMRAFGALAVSAGAAFGLWLLVPDFFLGPYGEIDPIMEDLFRANAAESGIAPLLQSIPGLLVFHLCLLSVAGLRIRLGLREATRRDAWLLVAVGIAVGVLAAFHRYRLIYYYEMFAAVAVGGSAAAVGSVVLARTSTIMRTAAVPAVLVVLCSPYIGWTVGILFAEDREPEASEYYADGHCDWPALGRALATLPEALPAVGPGSIVTYAPPGPELSRFSGRGVVATGCHCNAGGMRGAWAILVSSPGTAREVARRRGVEFIVQCPSVLGWQGHDWYLERSGPEGVYARLARDDPPDWLVRVPAFEIDVEGFVVWRTDFDGVIGQRSGPVE